MNKNVKRIFFVTTLLIMLVAVSTVSATDNTTNTDPVSDTTISDTSNIATNEVIKTSDNTEVKTKNNNKNNIKKEAQTITLNSNNFEEYVTDGKFNEKVNYGDTIDIQGKLDSSKFALEIDKPLNIITSTGDAYYNSHTTMVQNSGDYNYIFTVSNGGSGTNITGINFHNTQVRINNATGVCINNITLICETNIGQRVGSFNIRGGSDNITVKNSFFMNYFNSGHSNVVIAGASNCLIENNTIQCDNNNGITGNLLYLTTYYSNGISNHNITIRNNTIRTIGKYYETNYGLVLEGSGHIIEGNIIDNERPVMAQYADANYGMETNIDEIIFNNNTIIKGTAQLVFPGIVANNTFNGGALLKQVYAYNNTFNRVTIQNNVKFENNTAKFINITGNNNNLTNNNVYSNEDYAVSINGENNTLTNNKLLSNNAYGEEAISNSTEYVSKNNSERMSRIFYINDDNILDYFNLKAAYSEYEVYYQIKEDIINQNDVICFNLTPKNIILSNGTKSLSGLIIKDSLMDNVMCDLYNGNTFINSTCDLLKFTDTTVEDYSTYPKNNTYILCSYTNFYENALYDGSKGQRYTIFEENGHIKHEIESNSKVRVIAFDNSNYGWYMEWYGESPIYKEDVFIDNSLDFISVGTENRGHISSNVHLIDGSASTTFTGITFDGNVIVESTDIKFINCTFNNNIELKSNLISLENNIFNGKIILNSSNNIIFNSNIINTKECINIINSRNAVFENNTITTTGDNTIVFDDDSYNNVVSNNVLVASSLFGDDSVIAGDNDVDDNTPSYDTEIIIDCDNLAFTDDDLVVNISVNNLNNTKPVSKGYVEVYYDGHLIDIKDLNNGTTSVIIPLANYVDGSDSYPIKVWYYDSKRYNNNITTKNIQVVKSNVSITVDEFTAKLNENATVTATFLNQEGNPVKDTNVTYTIGRSSYTVETVDGVATLEELVTKEWLDNGKITISFPNTDTYNSNRTTINMNLTKDDVTPTMTVNQENDKVNIYMELVDSLNNSITDGKITVTTIDGTQLNSTRIRNGTYNTTITLPEDYTENLIVNYTNSYYYNDFTQEIEITNNITETITKIDIPEIGLINTPIEIKATVTDTEGNIINNGLVLFTIDDEVIAQANITEGIATTTVTFNEEKELTIKATYQKTKEFASSNAETTINIQKPTTQLNIENVELIAGETVTLTATVTDQLGNNINGGKVVFKVNGKTVKDANGKAVYAKVVDGIASVNYTAADNLAGKDIEITAVYTGYKTYESAKANTTTTVNPKELTLTTTATTTQLTATLSDNTINTGKIVFKINGKTVKDANGKVIYAKVVNGTVSVDYTLPESYKAGNYTVTATFVASGYDRLVANTALTVEN